MYHRAASEPEYNPTCECPGLARSPKSTDSIANLMIYATVIIQRSVATNKPIIFVSAYVAHALVEIPSTDRFDVVITVSTHSVL